MSMFLFTIYVFTVLVCTLWIGYFLCNRIVIGYNLEVPINPRFVRLSTYLDDGLPYVIYAVRAWKLYYVGWSRPLRRNLGELPHNYRESRPHNYRPPVNWQREGF